METAIYNIAGEDTGKKIELNESIFGIEPNDHAIYLDVKQYMANNRQGTHKSKERAEIIGSTRKIKRQKGTGTARAGSIKSPLFRGGGRAFGPRPRNSALSYKAKNEGLIILENFSFEKPSTKEFVNFETNLKINDKKCLLVLSEQNKNIYLSSRNLKGSKVVMISELTTYDILDASVLLVVDSAIDVLESFFKK